MKPFDLEKSKAGEPVTTGDNREVRIVCFDRLHSVFPIIALIKDGNSEIMQCYTKDGYIYPNDNISTNNLFLKDLI